MAVNNKTNMYTHVSFAENILVCKLPPNAVDVEIHVRSAQGEHIFKEDLYSRRVSFLKKWDRRFQPHYNVKRKILTVLRRNGRSHSRDRAGPGPRPWTRQPSNLRRIPSFKPSPRAVSLPRPIPGGHVLCPLPSRADIMDNFLEYKQRNLSPLDELDSCSSVPSLKTLDLSSSESSLMTTPISTPGVTPIDIRPRLNWNSDAGNNLMQAAAESAADAEAAKPKVNDLNKVTPFTFHFPCAFLNIPVKDENEKEGATLQCLAQTDQGAAGAVKAATSLAATPLITSTVADPTTTTDWIKMEMKDEFQPVPLYMRQADLWNGFHLKKEEIKQEVKQEPKEEAMDVVDEVKQEKFSDVD